MRDMPERVWIEAESSTPGVYGHDYRHSEYQTEYVRADLAVPRPWSTAAELEALPVGSVVRGDCGNLYDRRDSGLWWDQNPEGGEVDAEYLVRNDAPGLILYVPETP